jgi:hypothetical protein
MGDPAHVVSLRQVADWPGLVHDSRREMLLSELKAVQAERELPDVVHAGGAARSFASRLHRGEEQCDENADNGDHHQQFD